MNIKILLPVYSFVKIIEICMGTVDFSVLSGVVRKFRSIFIVDTNFGTSP